MGDIINFPANKKAAERQPGCWWHLGSVGPVIRTVAVLTQSLKATAINWASHLVNLWCSSLTGFNYCLAKALQGDKPMHWTFNQWWHWLFSASWVSVAYSAFAFLSHFTTQKWLRDRELHGDNSLSPSPPHPRQFVSIPIPSDPFPSRTKRCAGQDILII